MRYESLTHLYEDCLLAQDACNLAGLAQLLAEAVQLLYRLPECTGTDWVNRHPAVVLLVNKMGALSGATQFARFSDAFDAVTRALEESRPKPDGEEEPIGVCPACRQPVYRSKEPAPIWTCPCDLDPAHPQWKAKNPLVTEEVQSRAGISANCGEHYQLDCVDDIPLHRACYDSNREY